MSVPLCCSIQNLYSVLFVLQMSICVCAQISMRVRESRGVTGKPSPAVHSISKPRSRGIPHYITSSSAGNPRVPAIIPRGGNPCRPLLHMQIYIYICRSMFTWSIFTFAGLCLTMHADLFLYIADLYIYTCICRSIFLYAGLFFIWSSIFTYVVDVYVYFCI